MAVIDVVFMRINSITTIAELCVTHNDLLVECVALARDENKSILFVLNFNNDVVGKNM